MAGIQSVSASFYTTDKEKHERPLQDIDSFPLECLAPYRVPRSHRRQSHMPGWYWCSSTDSHVFYESRLELQALRYLDFDPEVVGIWAQPFQLAIKPSVSQDRCIHVPDYFVSRNGRLDAVVDVKRAEDAESDKFRRVSSLTRRACEGAGLDYLVISEFEATYRMNLEWLSHYRHESALTNELAGAVEDSLCEHGSCTIESLAEATGSNPLLSLPVIFHLMWRQVIAFDMSEPMTEKTLVTMNREGKPNV